tara:strand:- start:90 stop:455 length:366 start_codon:yes stop_codon:yes gene_type:complete
MRWLLMGLGAYMVVAGGILLAKPQWLQKWLKPLSIGRKKPLWGAMAMLFGWGMMWAAPASRAPVFIQVLGCMGLLKGIYLFVAPEAHVERVMRWWLNLPILFYRVWGVFATGIGLAIVAAL